MVLGDVEESVISREIDAETDEEIIKVYLSTANFYLFLHSCCYYYCSILYILYTKFLNNKIFISYRHRGVI